MFFPSTIFSGNVPVQVLQTSRVATPPKGNSIYVLINAIIFLMLMGYIEYRIDHVGLKKHLPELTTYSMYTTGIFYVYFLFYSWKCSKMTKQINFYILCTCRRLYTIYIHIYALDKYHMHTYTSNYCQVYINIHTHAYRYAHTCTNTNTHTDTQRCTCMQMHRHTHVHAQRCICTLHTILEQYSSCVFHMHASFHIHA